MAKKVEPDYERLGRDFEEIIVKNYFELYRTRHQIWLSFIKGVFAGLGGVIGATVMVAVVLFALNKVGSHLPLVGHYFQDLGHTIETKSVPR